MIQFAYGKYEGLDDHAAQTPKTVHARCGDFDNVDYVDGCLAVRVLGSANYFSPNIENGSDTKGGTFLKTSEIVLLTAAGQFSFQFRGADKAHWVYRYVMSQILNQVNPQLQG